MRGRYKLHGRTWTTIAVLVALAVAIGLYIVYPKPNNANRGSGANVELVFADSNKGQLSIADKDGKLLSKAPYPQFSYLSFQAVAPSGGVLASLNAGSATEQFLFSRAGNVKIFSDAVANQLKTSILAQTSHQIFFVDNQSVVFVACPDVSTDCYLNKLDLSDGAAKKILNIGSKQTNKFLPPAFLVGYDSQHSLAYLQVSGANSLGKQANAIYQIDINKDRVMRTIILSVASGFASSLSPDATKLAYVTPSGQNVQLNVLNLKTSKTQTVNLGKTQLLGGAGSLQWSPDGSKIVAQSQAISQDSKTASPIKIIDIDLASNDSVNVVQQLPDPSRAYLPDLGWLDNNNIVYQVRESTQAYNFASATTKTFKSPLKASAPTMLSVPSGDLVQAAWY